MLSPSTILGPSEAGMEANMGSFSLGPASAPATAGGNRKGKKRAVGAGGGHASNAGIAKPHVPDAPPERQGSAPGTNSAMPLLNSVAAIGDAEEYGNDERQLNEFLKLHPMLSLESTSARTLQLVQSLFEQAAIQLPPLACIPKSYDDTMLRPAKASIGERSCACGDTCLCTVMARVRHGADTNMAFVGVEFLLPDERRAFVQSGALPDRRKKCLVCCRYYTHYMYLLARNDPNFDLTNSPLARQPFSNPAAYQFGAVGADASALPAASSPVHRIDGYKPEAMLFVDEGFANTRAAREERIGAVMWSPVVRFNSKHYRYEQGHDGPFLVQVGIGVDDQGFPAPPPGTTTLTEASAMVSEIYGSSSNSFTSSTCKANRPPKAAISSKQ